MTNPTDPRVEAACLEFWGADDWGRYSFLQQRARKRKVASALKAADEAAWRPIESAPKNQRLKLAWLGKDGKWRFEFDMASWDWRLGDYRSGVSRHHAATHWQYEPTPPETP